MNQPETESKQIQGIQPRSQSLSSLPRQGRQRRETLGTRLSAGQRLRLVLSFFNRSVSEVMQNQSKHNISFETQLKSALVILLFM